MRNDLPSGQQIELRAGERMIFARPGPELEILGGRGLAPGDGLDRSGGRAALSHAPGFGNVTRSLGGVFCRSDLRAHETWLDVREPVPALRREDEHVRALGLEQ